MRSAVAEPARPILFPTEYPASRRILVLLAAVFAVLTGYAQTALNIGQTPAEFSADSDATLRVAGWAFSIWGLIYLGLLAYGVYQAWPKTPESTLLRRLAWPSVAAMIGIGLWIFAAAFDWEGLTIALIVGSAVVLILPMTALGDDMAAAPLRERALVAWPLALLAGWLTIASAVNILTVLTGDGALPEFLPPTGWAILAVAVVVAIAVLVTGRTRVLAYPIPIVWGLIAVFAAEQQRNPTLAFTAMGAAILLAIAAVILCFRLKRKPAAA